MKYIKYEKENHYHLLRKNTVSNKVGITQETQDIESMLDYRWSIVYDVGPKLNPTLIQRLVSAG